MAEVRPAERADLDAVSAMLARAFDDDPVTRWFYPDDDRRPGQARRFFGQRMRALLAHEQVYTTADRAGAALWALPGRWKSTFTENLRLLPFALSFGRRLPAVIRGVETIESRHPEHPRHFYLAVLGVEPERHGEGIGSALLQPVLDICDGDGVGAYLESSKERNVDFYARHGFRVTSEIALPDGPPLWLMWRDPGGATRPGP